MNIIQIGAGGIGGYLVLFLSKFLQNVNASRSSKIQYCIWDGDVVEEKNIRRQNFHMMDVGMNKAECLGKRYCVPYATSHFTPLTLLTAMSKTALNVLLTCVDLRSVRLDIYNTLMRNYDSYRWILIDGGNTDTTGQVVVAHNTPKACSPVSQLPSVDFNAFFASASDGDFYIPSCSEMGDQSIMVNVLAAINMYNIVTELIVTNKVSAGEIRFTRYSWIPALFDMNNAITSRTL